MTIEVNRNVQTIISLKAIAWPPERYRKALSALTGITHPELAKMTGASRSFVTLVMSGRRQSPKLQTQISEAFQVPEELMFPDGNN